VQPGGLMVNEYMVREGFAREYTFRDPYVHQSEFKADQEAAKDAKKGLWGACTFF
jgi:endonuclease YncB( thermonuclease family)